MGRQIAGDRNQDVPALVGIAPNGELSDPRFQHLIGMEACVYYPATRAPCDQAIANAAGGDVVKELQSLRQSCTAGGLRG
jgi:hypothetical protein